MGEADCDAVVGGGLGGLLLMTEGLENVARVDGVLAIDEDGAVLRFRSRRDNDIQSFADRKSGAIGGGAEESDAADYRSTTRPRIE